MKSIKELASSAERIFKYVSSENDVKGVEVFVSSNEQMVCRLVYTSNIPCNGVEEPKSNESFGFGLRVIFQDGFWGFGSENGDLSFEGASRALTKARHAKVEDSEFYSLPKPDYKRTLYDYHDPVIMNVNDEDFVSLGWKVIEGGLKEFDDMGLKSKDRLILSGDITILKERIAVKSNNIGLETDESALIMSFVTAMVEKYHSKGSGYQVVKRLKDFSDISGRQAATGAIKTMDGKRVPSGKYTVLFGSQPVGDIFNLFLMSLTAPHFYMGNTPFLGKLGSKIIADSLTIIDDGCNPELAGSKGITCEGLPTRRTELVKDGRLVGLLSDYYELERLLHLCDVEKKLGIDAVEARKFLKPANGFRCASGGGRAFDSLPGIAGTNVLMYGKDEKSFDELLSEVNNGLYIGRIWYTYPMGSLRTGEFTCSVVADSYLIENGKLSTPLRINSVRINDNFVRILNKVTGVSSRRHSTLAWAEDECTFLPEIVVPDVSIEEIKAS